MEQIIKVSNCTKEAIFDKVRYRYAFVLLYQRKDRQPLEEFFLTYGVDINGDLGVFPLYTCFEPDILAKLGDKFIGFDTQYNNARNFDGDIYNTMEEVGKSFGVLTYPTIIFLDKISREYMQYDLTNLRGSEIFTIIYGLVDSAKKHNDSFTDAIKYSGIKSEVEIKVLEDVFMSIELKEYVKRVYKSKKMTKRSVCAAIPIDESTYTKRMNNDTIKVSFVKELADAMNLDDVERKEFYKTFGIYKNLNS